MKNWLICRAQTPPNFDFAEYRARSSEPIRFDVVTVVQAETAAAAVNALIGSTGMIVTGFAAVECDLITFESKTELGKGGILVAEPTAPELAQPQGTDE